MQLRLSTTGVENLRSYPIGMKHKIRVNYERRSFPVNKLWYVNLFGMHFRALWVHFLILSFAPGSDVS